jgi:small subunit ribosomal protein S5
MELVGVRDILTKSLGSANALNIVNATISGLLSLRTKEQILSKRSVQDKQE